MSPYDLVLVVIVGAGAFYAGYQVGRFKALSERRAGLPPRQRRSPSPAPASIADRRSSAGGTHADAGAAPGGRPPRPADRPSRRRPLRA